MINVTTLSMHANPVIKNIVVNVGTPQATTTVTHNAPSTIVSTGIGRQGIKGDQGDNSNHATLTNLQGGIEGERYHLTAAQVAKVDSGGLIASWTQTGNKVVVVSAVDVDTDTFTSVGHSLANNDLVVPFLNIGAGEVGLRQYLPGGLAIIRHYVVNATADTFQIALTSKGTAIDLTLRGTENLTKWHFESATEPMSGFTGITQTAARLVVRGQFVNTSTVPWWNRVAIDDGTASTQILSSDASSANVIYWCCVALNVTADSRGAFTTLEGKWTSYGQLPTTADATVLRRAAEIHDKLYPIVQDRAIGAFGISGERVWANGSIMEVYAA